MYRWRYVEVNCNGKLMTGLFLSGRYVQAGWSQGGGHPGHLPRV